MREILECEEFGELAIRVSDLLEDGELRLDERVNNKGYLAAALKSGQIVLRATKFVGTIPLTRDLAIRVKPRASISSLSYMLVRSGVIPTAISGFSRGYFPHFIGTQSAEKIYSRSLIDGIKLIVKRGFLKEYIQPSTPSFWRGRLKTSDTIRRYFSKGIKYRHDFDHTTLSSATIENIALKAALSQVKVWFQQHDVRNPIISEINLILHNLWAVPNWDGRKSELISQLAHRIQSLSPLLPHYREPLWTSLLILQGTLPEVALDGFVKLDSLIVDVSAVFEAFLRRELTDRLRDQGYVVWDGNRFPSSFFRDGGAYRVHPDIIIKRDGIAIAVFDVKYKPDPKEHDRYEVLSFMDAMKVTTGGFICPAINNDTSRYLGETESGKKMFSLRYDLATADPDREVEKLVGNIIRSLNGNRDFI